MNSLVWCGIAAVVLLFVSIQAFAATEDSAAEDSFLAGVSVRDITPGPGIPLWGYSNRSGPATGMLDPLYAKAVVFRAGGKQVGLVTLDLGRVPLQEGCERIRERAKRAGIDYVLLTATHTHHAPVMEAGDAPYVQAIEKGIGDAIEEAVKKLQPAKIGVGRATIDIAHNRRKLLDDGRCLMIWRNEKKVPTEPVDQEAGIVKISGADGAALATLVFFACHPVVMGPSNCQYSADYPGEMARLVKEQTGGECLFFQGACGNLNPYLDKTPLDKGAVDAMHGVGKTCADAVLAALDKIGTSAPSKPSVAFSEQPVTIGTRWDLADSANREVLRAVYGPRFDAYIKGIDANLAVPLGVVVLNGNLALAGMPGEMFVQYQLGLKEGSPVRDTFLCGYANGFYGYFPTVRDAAAGGYGGTMATYVGLGAGDKLLSEAEIAIGTLAGTLRPACAPEDFALLEEGE